jgi:predicted TIM-barrel fold metal-dependent hydrolase
MSNSRYDAHCHIFTLEYLLKEVKSICLEIRDGEYPFQWPSTGLNADDSNDAAKCRNGFGWREIYELLCQLHQLISAALTSEEENMKFLDDEIGKAYPGSDPHIVPLMMDIFYILGKPLGAGQDWSPGKKKLLRATTDMQGEWEKALDAFSEHLAGQKRNLLGADDSSARADAFALELIAKERDLDGDEKVNRDVVGAAESYCDAFKFHKTKGYTLHMNRLMELVGKCPGRLHPFVAVDARREGIVDAVYSGQFFTGKERFYGVKLYPRLGCHPLAKPMQAVYEYCQAHNLPITFHCGKGGFPPSEKWAYADYGNPAHFESILHDYPNLRIDFAHMGSSDSSYDWKDAVMGLVNRYDNAYTDFSCYTEPEELKRMKERYWANNPKLLQRLLFGTDFDVMYFTGRVTMESYYKSFSKTFTESEMDTMMHDNPERFLGLA